MFRAGITPLAELTGTAPRRPAEAALGQAEHLWQLHQAAFAPALVFTHFKQV